MKVTKYDLAIIGSGPAGYVGAIRGAQLGARVVVFEKGELGGTCMNVGCIPTKAMMASTQLLSKIMRSSDYGIEVKGNIRANYSSILKRAQKVVEIGRKGIQSLFDKNGIDLIQGRAALIEKDKIQVEEEQDAKHIFQAERILVATGSHPMDFKDVSFDGEFILSSDDLFLMEEVPQSLTIIGGGVEGCEWAFIFAALGCQVTVVEMMERILPLEDLEISKTIQREMKKRRIRVKPHMKVKMIKKQPNRKVTILFDEGSKMESEKVLIAIGRIGCTRDLGLEKVGVKLTDSGAIKVNRSFETDVPGIYAAGDVIGGVMLAHVASAEAIVAVQNSLGEVSQLDYESIPAGIFTSPEIGRVGLTEEEALKRGIELKTGKFHLRVLGKAHAIGEIEGFVKILVDTRDDRIVGAHILGSHAADIIHELALAMRWKMKAHQVASLIHAHPTLSEAIMEAAEDVAGKSIHAPPKNKRKRG